MHVVVTGASSGIGEALARELAKVPGAKVTLVARREDRMRALAADLGVPTLVLARDLSDPAHMDTWVEEAERAHGPVDLLVNNAGAMVIAPTSAVDVEAGEAALRLNLVAPLRLTRRVLPGMIARGKGAVVNIASMAALAPTPGMTYYNASKSGLAAASEALQGELRGSGVHVVTVYPGIIGETAMAKDSIVKFESTALLRMQPSGTTAELARLVRRAIEKKQPRIVYPRVYAATRWFPALVRWFMDRMSPALRGATA
jgi:short-subunit dehydrogenase